MRRLPRLLALGAAFGFVPAAALSAHSNAPPPQAEDNGQSVTVVGERERSEAEQRREASRFFESHAVRTRIGQLARWHEPICVRTGGLPPELSVRIATRIMAIAERLRHPDQPRRALPAQRPYRLHQRAPEDDRAGLSAQYGGDRLPLCRPHP